MRQRRIYQDINPYFITIRTRDSYPLFEKLKYADLLAKIIYKAGELKGYKIPAFQIMPDHIHLLVWNSGAIFVSNAPAEGCVGVEGTAQFSNAPAEGCVGVEGTAQFSNAPAEKIIKTPAQASVPALCWNKMGAVGINNNTIAGTPLYNGAGITRARKMFNISELIHGIKSYYYQELFKKENMRFSIWQHRFYDRIVDTDNYLNAVIGYIKNNPVKAGLPARYRGWPHQYFDSKLLKYLKK